MTTENNKALLNDIFSKYYEELTTLILYDIEHNHFSPRRRNISLIINKTIEAFKLKYGDVVIEIANDNYQKYSQIIQTLAQ